MIQQEPLRRCLQKNLHDTEGERPMRKIVQCRKDECPLSIRQQAIALMKHEWPQAFEEISDFAAWNDMPETDPVSFMLLKDDKVVSHVSVPWKYIRHEGQTYKAFGISEVVTHPSFRKRGYALQLMENAAAFIEDSQPDISLFTCDASLIDFYKQCGWEHAKSACLIGGTKKLPLKSDDYGKAVMVRFFSKKAEEHREDFADAYVYLELGEGKLW